MKIGRNQPCPCGSGQKYKRCHGSIASEPSPGAISNMLARHNADQRIRERQQGLGKPVIGARIGEHQIVAVGNRIHWSPTWKTFPDFLGDYIKKVLDPAWGNAEIAKPLVERHPIMQWYDAYCRYQADTIKTPGIVTSSDVVGIVACYLGLAYSLYLLDHNVELQARLVHRLKDVGNFQGAYYELLIANVLIRAGFDLTLEDETDPANKHCEFAAVSKHTGKKYWIEAKMRAVAGMLGRTEEDGGRDDTPLARLIPHLNAALDKPADDERLIFIDLNVEMPPDVSEENRPAFIEKATERLERFDRDGEAKGRSAYVFVTNIAHHRTVRGPAVSVVAPFGIGIPDFNRKGYFRMSERFLQERKHSDAIRIGDAFPGLTKFPSTFDGRLPSEAFENSSRPIIGQTYDFQGEIGVGTVTAANVDEANKRAILGVSTSDGRSMLVQSPMTDRELADYKENSDAYFGVIQPVQKVRRTAYELFEWFVETHQKVPRSTLLERMKGYANFAELEKLADEESRAIYCEGLVAMLQAQGKVPR